ncbi:MAG: hypothetical protein WAQ05_24845 [Rubrivivax sp.]
MSAGAALLSAMIALLASQAGAAEGLALPDERAVWPQWQARLGIGNTQLAPVSLLDRSAGNTSAVLGDYYFDAPGLRLPASLGGLRATSGLLSSPWRSLLPGSAAETMPYLGIGYTGLALKGGWGITADLGLALENPTSATRLGRAVFGNQGFDSAWRELRLSPVLQLGMHYTF